MDSRRGRRTKDKARKAWYAHYRQLRFARWLGFVKVEGDLIPSVPSRSNPQLSRPAAFFG